jgi:hypothetical protein
MTVYLQWASLSLSIAWIEWALAHPPPFADLYGLSVLPFHFVGFLSVRMPSSIRALQQTCAVEINTSRLVVYCVTA